MSHVRALIEQYPTSWLERLETEYKIMRSQNLSALERMLGVA